MEKLVKLNQIREEESVAYIRSLLMKELETALSEMSSIINDATRKTMKHFEEVLEKLKNQKSYVKM